MNNANYIVYLICDPDKDLFKIGVTKGLHNKRMRQLQTGNGTELHLVDFYETDYPFRLEKMLHTKFQNKREHGEWFKLDAEDIFKFREHCDACMVVIESLKNNPFFTKYLR